MSENPIVVPYANVCGWCQRPPTRMCKLGFCAHSPLWTDDDLEEYLRPPVGEHRLDHLDNAEAGP